MPVLLTEDAITAAQAEAMRLIDGLEKLIFGQSALIRDVVSGLLAGGHVLLEGLPGLGKTELVKGLAALSGCQAGRVQFTPDLLPADITGSQIIEEDAGGGRRMVFRRGPIFAQLVLADEINRASPKTQSALLQAMQEHAVTVLDQTHALPEPFFVLATQNPVELDGTYPLPEAQIDRFLIKCHVTGVDAATLTRLLCERPDGRPPRPAAVMDPERLLALMARVKEVALPEAVAQYIARLVQATRPELPEALPLVREHVRWGSSPRGALALAGFARAQALLHGRPAVGFGDVRDSAPLVLGHRLIMHYEASLAGIDCHAVIDALLREVPELPQ